MSTKCLIQDGEHLVGQSLDLRKQLLSIKEFGAVFGLGTTSTYALLKSGALRAVKVGGLTKIRREDAESWAAGLSPRTA
jgi:excisionase family DNA binding protein